MGDKTWYILKWEEGAEPATWSVRGGFGSLEEAQAAKENEHIEGGIIVVEVE